jgi:hypothetical protein
MSDRTARWSGLLLVILSVPGLGQDTLWDTAQKNRDVLTVSTLFSAQDVRDRLSREGGLAQAIQWCRETGVTRVFVESYRDGYTADRKALEEARDGLRAAGLRVSGCVTTTQVGKKSTGWQGISCYTEGPGPETLARIFEYTAAMFDEIMIDDFLFTDCQCEQCKKACGNQGWTQYRCDLMVRVSRDRILAPARKVNPRVQIILKYPQWYEEFHHRGYDVVRQTADFDRIWVGTETRDYGDSQWGGDVQYKGYYLMRWLGEIGGAKCGGGWFDWLGTTERTYLEQANQTVLAGAKEMLLFCYGGLQGSTGPADVRFLRKEMGGLFDLARLVQGRQVRGVHAPKPAASDAGAEAYVYDFVGMMGIPLVPTARIDGQAAAAFYPVHVLKDAEFGGKLKAMLAAGRPVLITDGLAAKIGSVEVGGRRPAVLAVKGSPKTLLGLDRLQLSQVREPLLRPFGLTFDAPNKVGLYLFGDDLFVVENFNDEAVDVRCQFSRPVKAQARLTIPADAGCRLTSAGESVRLEGLSPRTLVAFTCEGL